MSLFEETTKPYIGVTGFMRPEEVVELQAMFDPEGSRQLMVGVLASAKTLSGQRNRRPNRYPDPAALPEIIDAVDTTRAFALMHYAPYGPELRSGYRDRGEWRADERQLFSDCQSFLEDTVRLWGPDSRHKFAGFQYNYPLPTRPSVYWLESRRAQLCDGPTRSVLQFAPSTLQHTWRFADYKGTLYDYLSYMYASNRQRLTSWPFSTLLYDVSGGLGITLDPTTVKDEIEPLMQLVRRETNLRIGVAGGLSGDTVPGLAPLVQYYPEICIDAEGALRDVNDHLDLDAAKRYIEAALKLFP